MNGILQEKNQKTANNGKTYYTLKIDNKSYSYWVNETDELNNISIGNTLDFEHTEKQGMYNGKPVTYRNIIKINNSGSSNVQINNPVNNVNPSEKDKLIKRLALLKVSAEAIPKGSPADELVRYAKQLELKLEKWDGEEVVEEEMIL